MGGDGQGVSGVQRGEGGMLGGGGVILWVEEVSAGP